MTFRVLPASFPNIPKTQVFLVPFFQTLAALQVPEVLSGVSVARSRKLLPDSIAAPLSRSVCVLVPFAVLCRKQNPFSVKRKNRSTSFEILKGYLFNDELYDSRQKERHTTLAAPSVPWIKQVGVCGIIFKDENEGGY